MSTTAAPKTSTSPPTDLPFRQWLDRALNAFFTCLPASAPPDPLSQNLTEKYVDADGIGTTLTLNDGDEQLVIARGCSGEGGVYCALDISDEVDVSAEGVNLYDALIGVETELRLKAERINEWLTRVTLMRQRSRKLPLPPAATSPFAPPPAHSKIDPFDNPNPSPRRPSATPPPAPNTRAGELESRILRDSQAQTFERLREHTATAKMCEAAAPVVQAIADKLPPHLNHSGDRFRLDVEPAPLVNVKDTALETFPAAADKIVNIPELDVADQSKQYFSDVVDGDTFQPDPRPAAPAPYDDPLDGFGMFKNN